MQWRSPNCFEATPEPKSIIFMSYLSFKLIAIRCVLLFGVNYVYLFLFLIIVISVLNQIFNNCGQPSLGPSKREAVGPTVDGLELSNSVSQAEARTESRSKRSSENSLVEPNILPLNDDIPDEVKQEAAADNIDVGRERTRGPANRNGSKTGGPGRRRINNNNGTRTGNNTGGRVKPGAGSNEGRVRGTDNGKGRSRVSNSSEGRVRTPDNSEARVRAIENNEGRVRSNENGEGRARVTGNNEGRVRSNESSEERVRANGNGEGRVKSGTGRPTRPRVRPDGSGQRRPGGRRRKPAGGGEGGKRGGGGRELSLERLNFNPADGGRGEGEEMTQSLNRFIKEIKTKVNSTRGNLFYYGNVNLSPLHFNEVGVNVRCPREK